MRKVLKWIGIVIGGLLALIVIVVVAIYVIAEERIKRTYDITPEVVEIPQEVAVEREQWPLMLIDFCTECHGPTLSGQVIEDDPLFGTLVSENITAGEGGIGSSYTDLDWIRALRHGIDQEGKPLIVMPSQVFAMLSDQDLGQIIAYVKSMPPVDNNPADPVLGPLARVFLVAGLDEEFALVPAEVIDHETPRPQDIEPGVTVAYGEYLAFMCEICHLKDLSGGPDAGEGMNITPGGEIANWSEEDFFQTLRTGVAPDGEELDNEEMPWRTLGQFSDDDLKAIWLYLQSVPAIETEHR
jgi:cytochrome c553